MKIFEFTSGFPFWKNAGKEDNQKILDLYNSLSMEGGVFSIRFVKDPDYFKFCDYESSKHHVFIAENNDKVAEGMWTLSLRESYLNGKKVFVSHISDLRIKRKKERKANFSWTDIGLGIITKGKDIEELNGCNYFLGSFVAENKYAIQAIKDSSPWGISEISTYQMISILGRRPLKFLGRKSKPASNLNISITQGKQEDIPALKAYLDKQNRERAFGYIYEGENGELERRFKNWDGFSISSFYIARDASGEILGCFATWNPSKGRRIMVDKFPLYLAVLGRVLKIFGKKIPDAGSELEILYITSLELKHSLTIDQKRFVLNELLDALYGSGLVKKYHILAFCDYNKERLSKGMEKYYLLQKNSTIYYQLFPKGAADIVREDELSLPPGHEMVLT
jgi:hypothetical protein